MACTDTTAFLANLLLEEIGPHLPELIVLSEAEPVSAAPTLH